MTMWSAERLVLAREAAVLALLCGASGLLAASQPAALACHDGFATPTPALAAAQPRPTQVPDNQVERRAPPLDSPVHLDPGAMFLGASVAYAQYFSERVVITFTDGSGATRRSVVQLTAGRSSTPDGPGPVELHLGDLLVVTDAGGGLVRAINTRDGLYYVEWSGGGVGGRGLRLQDLLPPIPIPQLWFVGVGGHDEPGEPGSWALSPNIRWTSAEHDIRRNITTLRGEGDAGPATMTFDGWVMLSFESPMLGGGRVRVNASRTEGPADVRMIDTAGRLRVPTLAGLVPREGPARVGQRCPPISCSELVRSLDGHTWRSWSLDAQIDREADVALLAGAASADQAPSAVLPRPVPSVGLAPHVLVMLRSSHWAEHAGKIADVASAVASGIAVAGRPEGSEPGEDRATGARPTRVLAVRDLTDPGDDDSLPGVLGLGADKPDDIVVCVTRSPGTTIDRFAPDAPAVCVVVDVRGVLLAVESISLADVRDAQAAMALAGRITAAIAANRRDR